MTRSSAADPSNLKEPKLPRRDWILLPAIGVVTICLMVITMELFARLVFSGSKTTLATCFKLDDPVTGPRGIPNSVCWDKTPESPLIEYRFNSCGHRAGTECGPKPPGTYRIVMTGSSFALGLAVQREQTFAALLPKELSRQTKRTVEVYNEAMYWGFTHATAVRFGEVLTASPDMILWILTPEDIKSASAFMQVTKSEIDRWNSLSLPGRVWLRVKATASRPLTSVAELFGYSRTSTVLQHFLYQSQSRYVDSYLKSAGSFYLKSEPGAAWDRDLQQFDRDAASIIARATGAGVPLVAVLVPEGGQAAMISMGQWPVGFDPYKIDNELRSIIVKDGGTYIDILPDFRNIPNHGQYYFPVNGHPNAAGHAMLASLLAKQLTSGSVPALGLAAKSKATADNGN